MGPVVRNTGDSGARMQEKTCYPFRRKSVQIIVCINASFISICRCCAPTTASLNGHVRLSRDRWKSDVTPYWLAAILQTISFAI